MKQSTRDKLSRVSAKAWASYTKEERDARAQKCSENRDKQNLAKTSKETWKSYTKEEKDRRCHSISEGLNSEEGQSNLKRGQRKRREHETKEERDKITGKIREARRTAESRQRTSFSQNELVAKGTHNWPGERPCNNPTERVLDFALISIFLVDTNHNFKNRSVLVDCREFQLDFVSYLLRFGVEADEPDHKNPKRKAWDDERDEFIVASRELDFTHRYSTEYAITNLVDVIKEVYELVNHQREKYKLDHLTILVYDERWNSYYEQMQRLLKEWFYSKDKNRFKIFREKKREIDKQWLWLLEEESKKYDSNFAVIYRKILEKNLKFRNVTSVWRS